MIPKKSKHIRSRLLQEFRLNFFSTYNKYYHIFFWNSMKWYIGPLRYHITFSFMIFKKIFTSKTVSTWFAVIGCPNMFVSVFSQIWFDFEKISDRISLQCIWLENYWNLTFANDSWKIKAYLKPSAPRIPTKFFLNL